MQTFSIRTFNALVLIAAVAASVAACHPPRPASTMANASVSVRAESFVDPKPTIQMEPAGPLDERPITPQETVAAPAQI